MVYHNLKDAVGKLVRIKNTSGPHEGHIYVFRAIEALKQGFKCNNFYEWDSKTCIGKFEPNPTTIIVNSNKIIEDVALSTLEFIREDIGLPKYITLIAQNTEEAQKAAVQITVNSKYLSEYPTTPEEAYFKGDLLHPTTLTVNKPKVRLQFL